MSTSSWFKLDRREAGDQLLKNNERIKSIQDDTMNNILITVTAQFFQQFGFEGTFELRKFNTDRSTVKVMAGDRRTAATLKMNPKWLNQYLDNIVI